MNPITLDALYRAQLESALAAERAAWHVTPWQTRAMLAWMATRGCVNIHGHLHGTAWAAGERLEELARLVEGPVGDVVRTLSSVCFEVQRFGLCLEVMCGVWRRLMTRSERELWDR